MKTLFALVASVALISSTMAQDTLFGEAGTGQPTKTVIGILGGAAAGAAIGKGVGGKDGWWIGALTGSTVGGFAGNQWGAADNRRAAYSSRAVYSSPSYVVSQPAVTYVTTAPATTYVQAPEPTPSAPYGYLNNGFVKSPWSDFQISVYGRSSGQILYDATTGQPFRIP